MGILDAPPLLKDRVATTTVAPDGTPADFNTDGVADQVQINAAILLGGKVVLRKGTYILSGPITLGTTGVILAGEGSGTLISKGNYNQNIINVTGTDVVLENMKVNGNRSTATYDNQGIVVSGTNVTVRDLHITEVVHHGINTPGATGVTLENIFAENTGSTAFGGTGGDGVGIMFGANATNIKGTNLTSKNAGYHAFQIYDHVDGIFLDGLYGIAPGQTQNTGSGLKVNPQATNIHISNVSLDGTGSGGSSAGLLLLADTSLPVDDIHINNPTIRGFGQSGIEIGGATNVHVNGGNIYNNGTTGSASVDFGIRITDGITAGVIANHVTITGTKVYDNQSTPTQNRPIGLYAGSSNVMIDGVEMYGHVTSNAIYKDASWTGVAYEALNIGGLGITNVATGSEPRVIMTETDTGANSKRWDMRADSGALSFRTLNDSDTQRNAWLTVARSSATPISATFGVPVDLASNKITSLGTPTNATDAATKGYVDTLSGVTDRTAKFVVGATNADYADIPSAITAVTAAGGGHIYLRGETFNVSTVVNIPSNTTITGAGKLTKIVLSSGARLVVSSANDVLIEKLYIDGTAQVVNDKGIWVLNSSNVTIQDCKLDINGFGIFITAGGSNTTKFVTVQRCYLKGNGLNDVIGGGPSGATSFTQDVLIADNYINQDMTTNTYDTAFDMVAVTRVRVHNNVVQGYIRFGSEQYQHTNSSIVGNTVRPAIAATGLAGILVDAGAVQTASSVGIVVASNTVVSGNIDIRGTSTYLTKNVTVVGNNVATSSLQNGVHFIYSTLIEATGNVVTGAAAGFGFTNSSVANVVGNNVSSGSRLVNDVTGVSSINVADNTYSALSATAIVGTGTQSGNIQSDGTTLDNTIKSDTTTFLSNGAGNQNGLTVRRDAGSNNTVIVDTANTRVGMRIAVGSAPNATLHLGGSLQLYRTSKTADYTIVHNDDCVVGANTTTAPINFTLPSAVVAGSAKVFYIVDESGTSNTNAITLTPVSSQTIDGNATATINTARSSLLIYSDGANWHSVSPSLANTTVTPGSYTNASVTVDAKGRITAASSGTVATPTQLNDTNGNSEILTVATASAVNQLTVTNSATGTAPSITATGTDANVGLTLKSKGTGLVKIMPGTDSANAIRFRNAADSSTTMNIDTTSGRVGILQGNPTTTLDVAGTITSLDHAFDASTGARSMTASRATTGAGNTLTVQAGGAQSAGTNLAGGTLNLKSGIPTGTGTSSVTIQTPTPGTTGTADAVYATRATFDSTGLTLPDAGNIAVGSTTGTQIGTATTQKLGFYGSTPVVQPTAGIDLGVLLTSLGLRASGTAYAITTSGTATLTGNRVSALTQRTANVTLATSGGTEYQICNATTAAFTVTLPNTTTAGIIFTIKKVDASANAVTVTSTSIDGSANYVLASQYKYVKVISTSTSGTWYVVGGN